jgi:hypothetical protein
VKDHYTVFKRTTAAQDNPGTTRRGILFFGQGGPGRGRGGDGRGGGNDHDHDARKPSQDKIDACTHIKARKYDSQEYCAFTSAKKSKHRQLINPSKIPRGVGHNNHQRTSGRIGSRRIVDNRKAPPSKISETGTKRTKYEETTNKEDDLFLTTDC